MRVRLPLVLDRGSTAWMRSSGPGNHSTDAGGRDHCSHTASSVEDSSSSKPPVVVTVTGGPPETGSALCQPSKAVPAFARASPRVCLSSAEPSTHLSLQASHDTEAATWIESVGVEPGTVSSDASSTDSS